MWNFITGVRPPVAKKRKTNEEIREHQRAYEQTRKRDFQQSMICIPCATIEKEKGEVKGAFVTGTSNFKTETLKHHELSLSHKLNVIKMKAKKSATGTCKAEKTLQTLSKANFDKMCLLFRSSHGIAKQGRPYSDFPFLCELDEMKGLNIGHTYRNDKSCQQFVYYIAEDARVSIKTTVDEAKFISIISDGATDSAHMESEKLYTRFCHKGILKTHFTCIKNIGKADAETISKALSDGLSSIFGTEWKHKRVGIATDGSSVMVGKKTGVVKRMKDYTNRPFIQGIHCSAHRLELSFKDATKDVAMWSKASNLLLGVYLFYRNSSLNRSNLKQAFSMEDIEGLIPSRVAGTRWIQNPCDPAHHKESARKAVNFLSNLVNKSMVAFLLFMWDDVSCLSVVSEAFQRKEATLGDVYVELQLAKRTLAKYNEIDGPKLKPLTSCSECELYEGQPLKGNLDSFKAARVKILDRLISSMTDRFEIDGGIAEACCITNFNLWPPAIQADFGDDHIASLVRRFSQALKDAGYDEWQVEPKWVRLKDTVYRLYPAPSAAQWEDLNSQLMGQGYENILGLVNLIFTLPASSVEAERGFSAMGRVKTDWRSNLKDNRLSDLLMVLMETPEVKEFDPAPCIHLWNSRSTRARRPDFMETQTLSSMGIT